MSNRDARLMLLAATALCIGACTPPNESRDAVPQGDTPTNSIAPAAGHVSDQVRSRVARVVEGTMPAFSVTEIAPGPGGVLAVVLTDESDNFRHLYWATPDGSHLIAGMILDPERLNPTRDYLLKFDASPGFQMEVVNQDGSVSQTADIADQIAPMVIAKTGSGDRQLYVFADPMCPHCQSAHRFSLDPEVAKHVTLNWVAVSNVGGDRSRQLFSELRAGQTTFDKFMTAQWVQTQPVALTPADEGYLQAASALLRHTLGREVVPAVVYEENGVWLAKGGFDPAAFTPNEVFMKIIEQRNAAQP